MSRQTARTTLTDAVAAVIDGGMDGLAEALAILMSEAMLESLSHRGLHGVQLFVADDHPGLKAARQAVFPGAPWQRCQFHLQRNAQAHAPRKALIPEIHNDCAPSAMRQIAAKLISVDGRRGAQGADRLQRPARAAAAPAHEQRHRTL